jgi:hypothetical protein
MADKTRFIVFGCRPDDTLLVENHTDDFDNALMYADVMSTSDYKARIFDREKSKFVDQHVIDLAIRYMGQ